MVRELVSDLPGQGKVETPLDIDCSQLSPLTGLVFLELVALLAQRSVLGV